MTIYVYVLLRVVFGGTHVVEHVRLMGWFWGLLALVLRKSLCNLWVWVGFDLGSWFQGGVLP